MDPFDEDPQHDPHWRKNAKWLHAGIYKDVNGVVRDIYYAFRHLKDGSHRIEYALNKNGSPLGNLDVGQIKRNLITWDDHHVRKWTHLLTVSGTWQRKRAKFGRAVQRRTLLETYRNPNFNDPFPNGTRIRAIGPPLNVIHHEDDESPAVGPLGRLARLRNLNASINSSLAGERCYPGTKIPLSLADIKVGAYKDEDRDPLTVISNFLTGKMSANPRLSKFRDQVIDRVESAFYELGWRADRVAIGEVSDQVYRGGTSAFESRAWQRALPIRVDRFKGDEVANLMRKVRGDVDLQDDDLQDDSEDEEDLFARRPPFARNTGPRAAPGGRSSTRPNFHVDSQDDSDDEDDSFAPDAPPVARATGSKVAAGGRSSARPNSFVGLQDDSDEEEDLLVSQRPSVARATGSRVATGGGWSAGSGSLENALLWDLRGSSRPVAPAQDSDDDSYLSDHSPRKGKAPASRKRRMKKGEDRDDSPPKRIKTEEPIIIDDSDIEIVEDRSYRRAIKAEPDVEIDEEKSTPPSIKTEPNDLEIDEERSSTRPIKVETSDLEIDEERSSTRPIKAQSMDLTQDND